MTSDRGAELSLVCVEPIWRANVLVVPPLSPGRPYEDQMPRYRKGHLDPRFLHRPLKLAKSILRHQPGAAARVQGMRRRMQDAFRHAASLMSPRGIQAALPFAGNPSWWSVYGAAAGDASGRVAQLAGTCPGLLLMALALGCGSGLDDQELSITRRWREPKVFRRFLNGVLKGERFKPLLDQVTRAWMRRFLHGQRRRGRFVPPAPDQDRMARDMRIRIRRAGPKVPTDQLLMPPPPAMVPGEIPREAGANRRWFEYTSLLSRMLYCNDELYFTGAQVTGVSRFLSRQWPDLDRHGSGYWFGAPFDLVNNLLDYLAHTDRVLTGSHRGARVLADMQQWMDALYETCELPADAPMRTLGLETWKAEAGSIRPLRTAGELMEESKLMQHCVASMAPRGMDGRAVFLHGEFLGAPFTLEVRPEARAGGFHLAEARGARNRLLNRGERALVRRWLRVVNGGPS